MTKNSLQDEQVCSRTSTGRVRAALVALSLAYFVMGTGSLSVIGLLPMMASGLDVSNAAIARLVAVFAVTFALTAPLIQSRAERVSPRLLLIGLTVFSLGALASALAPNYGSAVAGRILIAVGAAAIGPSASALGAALVPHVERGRALAVIAAGMAVSTIVGVPAISWLGNTLGWRWAFGILAGAGIAAALTVSRLVPSEAAASALGRFSFRSVFGDRVAARLIILTALHMAAQFSTYSLAAVFLIERFGVSPDAVSLALLLFGIGGFAGTLASGRLVDSFGGPRTLLVALLSLSAMFVCLLILPKIGAAGIAGLSLLAFAALLFQAPQQQWLVHRMPHASGLALALNASAAYIGMAVGAATGSAAYQLFGPSALPIMSLVYLALALHVLVRVAGSSTSSVPIIER